MSPPRKRLPIINMTQTPLITHSNPMSHTPTHSIHTHTYSQYANTSNRCHINHHILYTGVHFSCNFSLRIQVQLNLPFALILIITNSAQQNFPKNIITFFRSWHVQNVVLTRWSGMIIQVQQKVVSPVLEL